MDVSEEEKELFANLALVADPPSAGISSPGAALSLALHCLLVSKGFTTTGPGTIAKAPKGTAAPSQRSAALRPPSDWQAEGPNEWNSEYTVAGRMSPFKLVVALHRNAGRVFVHASEAGNLNNIQVLGLLLDVYVPDAGALASATSWDQVLQNAGQLVRHMNEHIIGPLLRNAAPGEASTPSGATTRSQAGGGTWSDYLMGLGSSSTPGSAPVVAGAGVALALAVAAGLWFTSSATRSRRH